MTKEVKEEIRDDRVDNRVLKKLENTEKSNKLS